MSTQGLTEEQRKKIEENKKRALARRAEKGNVSLMTAPSSSHLKSSTSYSSKNDSDKHLFDKRLKILEEKHTSVVGSSHQKAYNVSSEKACKPTVTNFYSNSKSNPTLACNSHTIASQRLNPSQKIQPLKGKCVLTTYDTFFIEIGYHSALVEFFKQQKTRSYDAAKKVWSFKLEEYNNIMKGLNDFRPDVHIEGFPKYILDVFRKHGKDASILPEVDLSSVSSTLVKTLKPFQREGVNIAIHRNGRLLLADDMGLGKTLQAICVADYYKSEWPLLIVAPSSVRFDWAQQICRWLPDVSRCDVNVVESSKASATSGLINIISYDLLSKKEKELRQKNFKVIIMDESHFLKNYKTVRTRAALPLLQNARRVLLLSGTPALSRPCELYCQIIAVCPMLFKFHDFGLRYCAAKQNPWGWDYSGSSNMLELQLLLEKCIMIRRQKKDVLSQLPAKTRQLVVLDPSSIQKHKDLKSAGKIMDKAKSKGVERRGALMQYFQETGRAKIAAVREYILDLLEADKKLLVFAHHREMLDAIEDCVQSQSKKVEYIRIDGNTGSEQRSFFCKKFQTKEEYKLAILSITAANAGLNLSAASTVVFAELFWNPGILVQAEDRAHRIGQKDSVSVQYLLAQGTADDCIWPLIQDKLDVLGKAGLTKDDFSEADTKIMTDPSQTSLLELFSSDFIETTMPVSESVQDQSSDSVPRTSECAAAAVRSEIIKQSPSKRQASITNFIQTTPVKKMRLEIQAASLRPDNSKSTVQDESTDQFEMDDFFVSNDDLAAIESLEWDDQM